MTGRYESILEAVGHTPLVGIQRMCPNPAIRLYAKLEMGNPTGSVKDRAAVYLVEDLERRGYLEPDAERLKAELTLHGQHVGAEGVEAARASFAAHPDDFGRQFVLAEALAAAGEYPEALELCLDLVEKDRKGVGESARKTMIAIFQVLPGDSELVNDYRRRLSFVL